MTLLSYAFYCGKQSSLPLSMVLDAIEVFYLAHRKLDANSK